MNSNRNMQKRLLSILTTFGLAVELFAGEPIEFSTSGKTSEHVKKSQSETYLHKRETFNVNRTAETLQDMQGAPTGPRMKSQRDLQLTREQEDKLSYKNSWIFRTPGTINQPKTANEVFGIEEFEADGTKKKKLSYMEQYLKEKEKEKKAGQGAEEDPKTQTSMGSGMQSKISMKSNNPDSEMDSPTRSERSMRDLFNNEGKTENRSEFSLRNENQALLRTDLSGTDLNNDLRQAQHRKEREAGFQQLLEGNYGAETKVRESLIPSVSDNRNSYSPSSRALDNLDRLGSRSTIQTPAAMDNKALVNRPSALDNFRRLDSTAPSQPMYQAPTMEAPRSSRIPSVLPVPKHNR